MKRYGIEIKWAISFSIISILWIGLERLVGLHDTYISVHMYYTNLFAIIAILVYVFALRDKRENYYDGIMSWTQGFVSGIIISAIVAVLSPLAVYISVEYIAPDYFPNIIEYSVQAGHYETVEDAGANFNLTSYITQSVIGAMILGVVTSAVVAIFVRRKAPAPGI